VTNSADAIHNYTQLRSNTLSSFVAFVCGINSFPRVQSNHSGKQSNSQMVGDSKLKLKNATRLED